MRNDIKMPRDRDSFICLRRLEIGEDHPPGEIVARKADMLHLSKLTVTWKIEDIGWIGVER